MAINPDLYAGNIIMSRVRLARNFKDYPFKITNPADAKEIVKKVNRALVKTDTFNLYFVSNLSSTKLEAMKERHLISQNLIENDFSGAVLLSQDEQISIMIHEEDVLREQCFMRGLRLQEAYKRLSIVDDAIESSLDFAYSDQFGYLTACPTNVGTGLRASVMLHLPVTESSGEISRIADSVGKIGFIVRGMYGEGSKPIASMYQVSNQITLGISEKNALDNLKIITEQLIDKERGSREGLNRVKLEDTCMRALGVLQNCRVLSSEEMMNLLSRIKLGISMGIIKTEAMPIKLLIEGQPYMLMKKYGQLEPEERDIYRANRIREALA
jgi:protein arginine kinase